MVCVFTRSQAESVCRQSQSILDRPSAALGPREAYLLCFARCFDSDSAAAYDLKRLTGGSYQLCFPATQRGGKICWHQVHTTSDSNTEASTQNIALLVKFLRTQRQFASPRQGSQNRSISRDPVPHSQQHAEMQAQHTAMSSSSPLDTTKRQRKQNTVPTEAGALIPKEVQRRSQQLGKLMAQQRHKPSCDKLEAKHSAKMKRKLQDRFRAVVSDAASMPHWETNPEGFLACLQDIERLFRQLFAPLPSESPPDHCCSVDATSATVSQCIDRILPVLLQPELAPAHNMTGVAEFLKDVMGMTGSQVFRCFIEEPSLLYMDVYSSLMPLQDFFQNLHWEPANYNQIISRLTQALPAFCICCFLSCNAVIVIDKVVFLCRYLANLCYESNCTVSLCMQSWLNF